MLDILMGKGILTIYIDNGLKEIGKSRGLNLSQFFEECLALEVSATKKGQKLTEKEQIQAKNVTISRLITELRAKTDEIRRLNQRIPKKSRIIEPKETIQIGEKQIKFKEPKRIYNLKTHKWEDNPKYER